MKRTTDPPGGKTPADLKKEQKDRASDARSQQRERQYQAVVAGWRAIWSEMKRVTWPSREEWVSATLVTIGLVIVVALWTSAIGQLAEWIFKPGT